jgi:hypothetical protein
MCPSTGPVLWCAVPEIRSHTRWTLAKIESAVAGAAPARTPARCDAPWISKPGLVGDLSHTPVRAAFRFRLQRLAHQLGDPFIADRSGTAWAQLVMQSRHPLLHEASPPFAHGRVAQSQSLGNLLIHFPAALSKTIRTRVTSPAGSERELAMLSVVHAAPGSTPTPLSAVPSP